MIKVLIIDDEPEGLQSAMAGLLPLPPKQYGDPDIESRVILAHEIFEIRKAESISKALEIMDEFTPDLVIIDIEIKSGRKSKPDGYIIENGIDLYRFIDRKYNETEKILFSNYGDVPAYMTGLSIDERMNFVSKAKESGYIILASRIGEYLKRISIRLISGLQ
ncbi:response regulator, partial [Chryseobacterium sp. EO14]